MSIPYVPILRTHAQAVRQRTSEINVIEIYQLYVQLERAALITHGAAACFLDLVI